jgi:PAS domain S-box-containing protein
MPGQSEPAHKARILIASNEYSSANNLSASLKNFGHEVTEAVSSAEEAIRAVEDFGPDLILMDVDLRGGTDGIQAAGQIQSRFDIPFIYLTDFENGDLLQRAESTEPYGYLGKHSTPSELRTRIGEALRKHMADLDAKESAKRLALALEGADLGWWDWNVANGTLVVNERWAEIGGRSLSEVAPHEDWWREHIHPEDRTRNSEELNSHLEGLSPSYEMEFRFKTKAGEWNWVRAKGKVVERDEGGRAVRMVGTMQGITESLGAETALRFSEEKYRALFEGSRDAIVMTALDGSVVDFNPAMMTLSGYSRDEIAKTNVENVYVNPVERDRLKSILHEHGAVRDFELQLRRKDGATRDCLLTSSLWKSDTGEILGLQTILRDVTERKTAELELRRARSRLEERVTERTAELTKINARLQQEISEREQAEEGLRRSEEKYRLLAENADDVIFTLDMNMTCTYVSPSVKDLRGFDPSEVIGQAIGQTLAPESLAVASRTFSEGLRVNRQEGAPPRPPARIELQMKCKDGTTVWTEVKCSFLRDRKGTATGILGIIRDLSDRKRMEDALRDSERQLRLIADNSPAYIAHVGMDDLRYSFVNHRFVESFGMPREEIIGKHIRDVIGESNYQFALKYIRQVKAGKPASYVNVFELEQGKRWINVNYVPDFDEQGQVRAIVVLSHDITDLKQAEEDLRLKTRELGGRVKELNCLYGSSKITEKRDIPLDQALQAVVDLMPPSWQYPEITCARIVLDGQEFKTKNCAETASKQFADILAHGEICGSVTVGYLEERPESDEGPFLKEERRLIDEIAERLGRHVERLRAEQALRESQEQFELFMDMLPHGVFIKDESGKVIYVNQYAKDLFNGEDWIGKDTFDAFPDPQRAEAMLAEDRRALAEGQTTVVEAMPDNKGLERVFQTTKFRINRENKPPLLGGIGLDITDRMKTEEALRKSEDNYRSIFDTANDAIFVHDIVDGHILDVNTRMLEMFGFCSKKEVVGSHVGKLSSNREPFTLTEARQLVEKARQGRPQVFEWHARRKDGSLFWIEVSLKRVTAGGEDRILAIVRDIEERKKAEQDFMENENRYRAFFNTRIAAMAVFDSETRRFRDVNESWLDLYGYTRNEVPGLTTADVSAEPELTDSAIRESVTSGDVYIPERRHKRKDGSEFFVQLSAGPFTWMGRNLMYCMIQDITERKKAEELLIQTEKYRAVADLASGVAHNFNNVLQIVLGNASLAQIKLESGELSDIRDNLNEIIESSRFGAETVRRLNRFAKSDSGSEVAASQIFDLCDVVKQATAMTTPWWKTNPEREGIKIRLDAKLRDDCWIEGNKNEVFEVLVNLIKNAVEALPDGGDIEILASVERDQVFLEIRDTGIGIPDENLSRLFTPFFTTSVEAGRGLGLATSRQIIDAHGGKIVVETVTGEGTSFIVSLPFADKKPEYMEVTIEPTMEKRLTILVIDDMEPSLNLLREVLVECRHVVFGALSGEEGLRIFRDNPVDAVICDLGMPGINGWRVGKAMKDFSDEKGSAKVPFILLTGWADQSGEKLKIAESGVDAVVEKPVDAKTLLEVIEKVVDVAPHGQDSP